MRTLAMWVLLLAVPFLAGCDDDEGLTLPPDVEVFTATLNGANERPDPVTTDATGLATFTAIEEDGAQFFLSWKLEVSNIDNATAAHIHKGVADSAGGVMIGLFSGNSGPDFSGVLELDGAEAADSILTHMRNGRAYVNVHTTANPAGEIRGQARKVQ